LFNISETVLNGNSLPAGRLFTVAVNSFDRGLKCAQIQFDVV